MALCPTSLIYISSADASALVDELGRRLAERDLFDPASVCTATRSQEDWLKLELAERFGVVANVHFLRLENLIVPSGISSRARLTSPRLAFLIRSLLISGSGYPLLERWLTAGESSSRHRALRLHQISTYLSGLFRRYALDHPDVLRRWRDTADPASGTSSWVSGVFHELTAKGSPVAEIINKFFDPLEFDWSKAPPKPGVMHLFGISRLSPLIEEILKTRVRQESFVIYEPPQAARIMPDVESQNIELPSTNSSPRHRWFSAANIKKEIEEVALMIWKELARQDAPKLRDIHILVPEAHFGRYEAQIRTIFARGRGLPVGFIRPKGRLHPLHDFVSKVLQLCGSPLLRGDVMAVLTHEVVQKDLLDIDVAGWSDLAAMAGIVEGRDRTSLVQTDIDLDVRHWIQGLRRLAQSLFGDPSSEGDNEVLDYQGDQWLSARFFWRRSLTLLRSLDRWTNRRQSLSAWGDDVIHFIDRFFIDAEKLDAVTVRRVLNELCLKELDGRDLDVYEFSLVFESLPAEMPHSGGLLDGICVMSPGQLVSCSRAVLFFLGCKEGDMPAMIQADPHDSLQTDRLGELGFLEQRLVGETKTASSLVSISFVHTDSMTGDAVRLSSCLETLAVESGQTCEPLPEEPPRPNFQESGVFPDLSRIDVLRKAQPTRSRLDWSRLNNQERHLYDLPTIPEIDKITRRDEGIHLSSISNFLVDPFREWIRRDFRITENELPGLWAHREPMILDNLDRSSVLRQALRQCIFEGLSPPEAVQQHIEPVQARGEFPSGLPGKVLKKTVEAALTSWISALVAATGNRVSDLQEHTFVQQLGVNGANECQLSLLTGPDCMLLGKIGFFNQQSQMIGMRSSKKIRPEHHLKNWLNLIALKAAGIVDVTSAESTVVLTTGIYKTELIRLPDGDACLSWLVDRVTEMNLHSHNYYLPFEKVMAWNKKRSGPFSAVLPERDRLWALMPEVANLVIPTDAENLIDRRFGFYFDCCESS